MQQHVFLDSPPLVAICSCEGKILLLLMVLFFKHGGGTIFKENQQSYRSTKGSTIFCNNASLIENSWWPSCTSMGTLWPTSGRAMADAHSMEPVLFKNSVISNGAVHSNCSWPMSRDSHGRRDADVILHLPRNVLWNNIGHVLLHLVLPLFHTAMEYNVGRESSLEIIISLQFHTAHSSFYSNKLVRANETWAKLIQSHSKLIAQYSPGIELLYALPSRFSRVTIVNSLNEGPMRCVHTKRVVVGIQRRCDVLWIKQGWTEECSLIWKAFRENVVSFYSIERNLAREARHFLVIYVSRKHATHRRLANEDEFVASLLSVAQRANEKRASKFGAPPTTVDFEVVFLENLDIKAQVYTWHAADVVVMTAGAAMHMSCFMRDGTQLVMVAHRMVQRMIPPWVETHLIQPPEGVGYNAAEWVVDTDEVVGVLERSLVSSSGVS